MPPRLPMPGISAIAACTITHLRTRDRRRWTSPPSLAVLLEIYAIATTVAGHLRPRGLRCWAFTPSRPVLLSILAVATAKVNITLWRQYYLEPLVNPGNSRNRESEHNPLARLPPECRGLPTITCSEISKKLVGAAPDLCRGSQRITAFRT
jgi:hypothetical protein